jgi:hypothetical protein
LVCLLPVYKGAGTPCHPLVPSGFGGTEGVGVYSGRRTTFGTSTSQRDLGRVIQAPKPCCSRSSKLTGLNPSAAPKGGDCGRMNPFSPSEVGGFTAHPPSSVGQLPHPRISRYPLNRDSRHNHPLSRAASRGSGRPSRRTPASASWDSLQEGAR